MHLIHISRAAQNLCTVPGDVPIWQSLTLLLKLIWGACGVNGRKCGGGSIPPITRRGGSISLINRGVFHAVAPWLAWRRTSQLVLRGCKAFPLVRFWTVTYLECWSGTLELLGWTAKSEGIAWKWRRRGESDDGTTSWQGFEVFQPFAG